MSNDTELFELCKEVSKAFPEWNDTPFTYWGWLDLMPPEVELTSIVNDRFTPIEDYRYPLYTSDYLLEKLPMATGVALNSYDEGPKWIAALTNGYKGPIATASSDTPLKALLKLTLALHEAGIKLKEPSDV